MNLLIVGAGLAGAVVARELNEDINITVIDKRNHVAGNCHTETCPDTGILKHVYGCHIFHTDKKSVWDFVNKYSEFVPFTLRVKANIKSKVVSLPINLSTINDIYNCNLSPQECNSFMDSISVDISDPQNFEEQALAIVGQKIYDLLFKNYTKKQWGVEPTELPASIIKRLPIRTNYNDAYFNDEYQAMPKYGYTEMVNAILDKPNIRLLTGTEFNKDMLKQYDHVIYTGAIDQYFDYKHGQLGYRTVYWKDEIHNGDYQGTALMTYPNSEEFTRIVEHKHFSPWQSHSQTIISKEYSKQTTKEDTPYYPIRLPKDKVMLSKYLSDAITHNTTFSNYSGVESDIASVSFLGRLGTYRYMDMHNVIHESMQYASTVNNSSPYGNSNKGFFFPTLPISAGDIVNL